MLIHELPSYTGTAYVSKNVNPIKWDSFVSLKIDNFISRNFKGNKRDVRFYVIHT